ncbi:hypothetical protein CLOP_g1625 [Closterium sp. NIES-67]|nr:hypothetical protein CLOP_g1625 [Closterium sp. NIES-67]
MDGSFTSNVPSSSSELLFGAERSVSPPPYIPAKVDAGFSPVAEKAGTGESWIPQECGKELENATTCEKTTVLNEWDALPSSTPQKNIIEELFDDLPSKPLECGDCVNVDSEACKDVPSSEWKTLDSKTPLVVSLLFFDDERSQLYVSLDLQLPSKVRTHELMFLTTSHVPHFFEWLHRSEIGQQMACTSRLLKTSALLEL